MNTKLSESFKGKWKGEGKELKKRFIEEVALETGVPRRIEF